MELSLDYKETLLKKLITPNAKASELPNFIFPGMDIVNPKYFKLNNILAKKNQISHKSKYSGYYVKEIFRKKNLYRYVSPLILTPYPEKKYINYRQSTLEKRMKLNENLIDRELKEKKKNPMSKMTTYTTTEKNMLFTRRKELIKLNAIEGVSYYLRRDQSDEDRYNYDVAKSLDVSSSNRLVVLSKNKHSNSYFP